MTSEGGKLDLAPQPPENRERNYFPFSFWNFPFACGKVLFTFLKVLNKPFEFAQGGDTPSPQTGQPFETGFFENRMKKTYSKPFTNL